MTASLTARIVRWYSNYRASVPLGLVFEHFKELAPRYGIDTSRQLMVLDHILHAQILYADGLVFTHEHSRKLVQEVIALVGYFFVYLSYLNPLFVAVA